MKRSSSRDTPPLRNKRTRSSLGRYDDSSDERLSPERGHRSRARSPPSPRPRYAYEYRDEYGRTREAVSDRPPSYKVLCVSALHPKASDELIKDTLYREYKKFGDLSIRLSHDLDERVAYVCFRSAEDARDAKHSKPRIILYDKVAVVDPVYETHASRSRPRSRSYSPPPPEYDRYYSRSPVLERRPGLPPPLPHPGERPYGYGPPVLRHEFRRDIPPHHVVLPHHEFLPRGPPLHHIPPHHPHHLPPPHHIPYGPPRHIIPRPPPPHFVEKTEKRDKFPNYLHHVPPEDDPLATRTLFAGNLELGIADDELRRIFARYGVVEDIDIKRPLPGTGNAYAFVRYQNLDMAHRSKVELSGQYIGKFQCKIGYGKATPTTRIWVGGLGPWTSITQLEREFDRFGAIKKIDYVKGDSQAYILYESVDAATAAVKEMRGFPLGGPERRLRLDFADVTPSTSSSSGSTNYKSRGPSSPYADDAAASAGDLRPRDDYPPYEHWAPDGYPPRMRGHDVPSRGRGGPYRPPGIPHEDPEWRRSNGEFDSYKHESSYAKRGSDAGSPRRRRDSDSDSEGRTNGVLGLARNLTELSKKCVATWQGALILKNSLFPAKFHLTDGDVDIIDSLMKDENNKHLLRITQRLRLDQPKLEDVSKRIATSISHAIFLGLAGSTASIASDDASVQTRPLRNLVSYLKQKEAAGVISLINKDTESTGVLYAFPPCAFSTELLKRTAHGLTDESLKEDHLVIVVVRGGTV
ncbi:hypothetical protein M8J76_013877 [Diaphorina citri]|nr:hypothetical protein M8J76_013877 [Diaphorina citri]